MFIGFCFFIGMSVSAVSTFPLKEPGSSSRFGDRLKEHVGINEESGEDVIGTAAGTNVSPSITAQSFSSSTVISGSMVGVAPGRFVGGAVSKLPGVEIERV